MRAHRSGPGEEGERLAPAGGLAHARDELGRRDAVAGAARAARRSAGPRGGERRHGLARRAPRPSSALLPSSGWASSGRW